MINITDAQFRQLSQDLTKMDFELVRDYDNGDLTRDQLLDHTIDEVYEAAQSFERSHGYLILAILDGMEYANTQAERIKQLEQQLQNSNTPKRERKPRQPKVQSIPQVAPEAPEQTVVPKEDNTTTNDVEDDNELPNASGDVPEVLFTPVDLFYKEEVKLSALEEARAEVDYSTQQSPIHNNSTLQQTTVEQSTTIAQQSTTKDEEVGVEVDDDIKAMYADMLEIQKQEEAIKPSRKYQEPRFEQYTDEEVDRMIALLTDTFSNPNQIIQNLPRKVQDAVKTRTLTEQQLLILILEYCPSNGVTSLLSNIKLKDHPETLAKFKRDAEIMKKEFNQMNSFEQQTYRSEQYQEMINELFRL